jgi:hypothetical protein
MPIRTTGMLALRPLLLVGAMLVLAGTAAVALLRELQPPAPQAAPVAATPVRALTPDEENFAAALWTVHREVTPTAVAMSMAGIAYKTESHDVADLQRRVEPLARVFDSAAGRARALSAPDSLTPLKERYVGALRLYADAAGEMLAFVRDGEDRHLGDAHAMGLRASEELLRVGDVLWPGQYKPN